MTQRRKMFTAPWWITEQSFGAYHISLPTTYDIPIIVISPEQYEAGLREAWYQGVKWAEKDEMPVFDEWFKGRKV